MLQKSTIKSKSFLTGILQIVIGIVLIAFGHESTGVPLIGTGTAQITLKDAIEKK